MVTIPHTAGSGARERQHGAPSPRRRRRQGGFTLIEVMIAICIVVIGLLGVFQALGSTILTNADARNRSLALRFAERQLEAVRDLPFSSITTTQPTGDPDLAPLGTGATWQRVVNTVLSGNLVGVTVIVRWNSQGQPQAISLGTLVYREGIGAIKNL
ncbi:MAG: prepilin-type N-terminal cleavage/methylation domain-containing protein [Armatimonadota bacterium]|nr:prepilin-type N-terminal cleavage/methylation domain-containing protein [Armatimonadota bacterium]